MDKERLAEILTECTITCLPAGGKDYSSFMINVAAELLKVCEIREKETDDKK